MTLDVRLTLTDRHHELALFLYHHIIIPASRHHTKDETTAAKSIASKLHSTRERSTIPSSNNANLAHPNPNPRLITPGHIVKSVSSTRRASSSATFSTPFPLIEKINPQQCDAVAGLDAQTAAVRPAREAGGLQAARLPTVLRVVEGELARGRHRQSAEESARFIRPSRQGYEAIPEVQAWRYKIRNREQAQARL